MTISFEDVVTNLKELIETDSNAHSFLDMLQMRSHSFPYIRVSRAQSQLRIHMDLRLSDSEIRSLFRSLEEAGAGRYRKKSSTVAPHFIWTPSIRYTDLVEAVFSDEDYLYGGDDTELESNDDEDPISNNFFDVDDDNYSERLITHPFILRKNIVIFIQIPFLLNYDEGVRLSSFINSLALGDDAENELIDHQYNLRSDLIIDISSVPQNLTEREASRIERFIDSYTNGY